MNPQNTLLMELVHAFLLGMIGWNIQLTRKTAKRHKERMDTLLEVLHTAFPSLTLPPPEPDE